MYQIIKVKTIDEYKRMNKKEAREYYNWYLNQIDIRVPIFIKYVNSFPNYRNWKGNFTPESLKKLGKWLCENMKKVPESKTELLKLYYSFPEISRKTYPDLNSWLKGMKIEDWTLSERTFSYCFDVGAYLSKVIILELPYLYWELPLNLGKTNIIRNRPIIKGFKNRSLQYFEFYNTITGNCFHMFRNEKDNNHLYNTFQFLIQKEEESIV